MATAVSPQRDASQALIRPATDRDPALVDARHPELDSLARSIETRICAISSRVFYEVYYFFNPPNLLPIHEFYPMPEYDEGHPIQYTFAQAKELYLSCLKEEPLGKFPIYEREHFHEYENPEFRLEQARSFWEDGVHGRARDTHRESMALAYCSEELHNLYESTYKKIREATGLEAQRLAHRLRSEDKAKKNQQRRVEHRREWDGMNLTDRAKKTCLEGRTSRYLIAAAGVTTMVTSGFFLWIHGADSHQ
jgi:hypothetical protein